ICVLVIDAAEGIKAQDRRIAALIQKARKTCVIVLNKWDLVRTTRKQRQTMEDVIANARAELFFIDYAPVLVTSALTGEHADKIFKMIERIRRAARAHIGTGKLNRALRAAFAANPPPMVKGKRLKLFYATQSSGDQSREFAPPEIVRFVNSPRCLTKPMKSAQEISQQVQELGRWITPLREQVAHVVIGQKYLVDRLLLGLLANGHVLLEGVPGLAKTLTVKTIASAIQTGFQRLQ